MLIRVAQTTRRGHPVHSEDPTRTPRIHNLQHPEWHSVCRRQHNAYVSLHDVNGVLIVFFLVLVHVT